MFRSLVLFLLCMMVTACSTVAVAPPSTPTNTSWKDRQASLEKLQSWQMNGKIAVQTANDSGSASIDWRQRAGNYIVSIIAPLGAGSMTLTGSDGRASLRTSDGKSMTAGSPESLLAKGWGFNVPVSYLRYWVRGLPVPGLAARSQFDAYNRLTSLSQQGWHVQYLSYTRAGSYELPSRIDISSSSLRTKLMVYDWQVG